MRKRSKKTLSTLSLTAIVSLHQCLAKSRKADNGEILPGRLVLSHCNIVGEVARAIIRRMPFWLQQALFPPGSELIAAAHDIGKVSPTFQKKIYNALTHQDKDILSTLSEINPDFEKNWGGHAGVSQAALGSSGENVGHYIPEIVGQHHGYSPNLTIYQAESEVFGGDIWQAQRVELLAEIKHKIGADFPAVKSALQARVLAGLTTVSDWIGSGRLFEDPHLDWRPLIEQALDEAGYIQPQLKTGLSFFDVFGFEPKETQSKLIEVASQQGVYILEAPMGLGKTEAALYVAYQMMDKNLAIGIYFALPTQLTSDKIHERVNAFLENILSDESPHKQALLVHGNAWLKQQFEMGEEGNPSGAWFAQGKRGILAPFAVGTIDQALMAVMNVKHGFVRTFGLAGKVVILDEVHSYDSYTGTILDSLIKALRQLNCTVIVLSATLTLERRAKLLANPATSKEYPLITAQPHEDEFTENTIESITDITVMISHHEEVDAVEEALLRAETGQQVLWIENTVKEAQDLYKKIAARSSGIGVKCGLLHSRFMKVDRAIIEERWVANFGKNNSENRKKYGRILIGTQVLEQSLDIDADFLITRIAPTDMLLQRLGRLWRHQETTRPSCAQREAWILAPDLDSAMASPESIFGATAKVYAPYVLCRTLEVWQNVTQVYLPGQIRELIEATYVKRQENGFMAKHLHHLETIRSKLECVALVGLTHTGATLPEEKAQTRYAELESTEVLLMRSYQLVQGGVWMTLLNNERLWIPHNIRSISRKKWRNISVVLMENTLKVADYLAPDAISMSKIHWLADYFYLGRPEYNESIMLRVALVDDSGVVKSLENGVANENYIIHYDELIGYQANKK